MKACNIEIMKMVKALEAEKAEIIASEERNSTISYSSTEKQNSLVENKPEYDLVAVNASIDRLDSQIRRLKHILNKANSENMLELEGRSMTVGEGIVYMAQLSANIRRLEKLANTDKLTRSSGWRSSEAEYTEVKYDINIARDLLKAAKEELMRLQVAIDRSNLLNEREI